MSLRLSVRAGRKCRLSITNFCPSGTGRLAPCAHRPGFYTREILIAPVFIHGDLIGRFHPRGLIGRRSYPGTFDRPAFVPAAIPSSGVHTRDLIASVFIPGNLEFVWDRSRIGILFSTMIPVRLELKNFMSYGEDGARARPHRACIRCVSLARTATARARCWMRSPGRSGAKAAPGRTNTMSWSALARMR